MLPRLLRSLCLIAFLSAPLLAQQNTDVSDAINSPVNDGDRVVLNGNVHPLAQPAFNQGPTDGNLMLRRMVLVLGVRPGTESVRDALIDQIRAGNTRPVTPAEFGQRFGVSDRDLQSVISWLQSYGLTIDEVANGRGWINFSGTVSQVERAFATNIDNFSVNGELHHANVAPPSIPVALSPVVLGVVSMHDFARKAMHSSVQAVPNYTSGGAHYLAPADFATIYDVNPLYTAGIDGTGHTIAIVGRTDIQLADVQKFRSTFGLPARDPVFVHNGTDPGDLGGNEETEADLDVEWSGGVAKNATIDFVISQSTATTDGVDLSAQYIVDNNLADAMSTSFGSCEQDMGSSELAFYSNLWTQAAAEAISAFVSSGDSGASGCDSGSSSTGTIRAVNGLCSPANDVCVGGSEFLDQSSPGTYWSSSNNASTEGSALSYIPEEAWNESGTQSGGSGLWSTGGGASVIYPKPSWQSAPGVPADGARDVPDVSLSSASHDGYLIFQDINQSGGLYSVGGTSAASPSFAGIMALVVQQTGARQGNANPTLYTLGTNQYANGGPQVFHDVTMGSNTVPGVTGFNAGIGYDQATGLGSVDANLFVTNWSGASSPKLTANASPNSITVAPGGASKPFTVTISASGFSGPVSLAASGQPTGATVGFNPASLTAPGQSSSTVTVSEAAQTPLGTYTLTVTASGGGMNATTTVTVNSQKSSTTTALTASPNPALVGQAVTLTATVSSAGGSIPNGETVTFTFGSQTLGTAPLSSGSASLTVSNLPQGSDTVTASYPGDVNFAGSTGSVVETVSTTLTTLVGTAKGGCADNCASAGKFVIPSTGTLSCANNDVIFVGAASVFSNTTMSISDSGGTIAWKAIPPVNGSTNTTAAGWWGVCSNLASGTITISCTSGCTASTYMDGVAQWYQTTAPNPASDGNSSGTSAGSLTLSAAAANSGDLSFAYIVSKNGGTLATGSSGWTKRSTGLEATASGFDNLGSGSGSVSITVTGGSGEVAGVIQNLSFSSGPAASTTAVTGSPNPSSVGQAVTLTATVSSSGGTPPNGEIITFSFGSQTLGTAPLSNGTASLSVSTLPQGSDTVTASYPGDTNFAASTGSVVETVNATGTTTALAASPNPANVGQAVMLTATVSSSSGTPPNGEVITFTFGSQALGTAPLSNGTASLGVSNLPQGSDTVTASYPGDSTFGASSGSTTETVNAVSTTTTLSGSPNPSTYGQAVTLTATVSAGSGTVPNGEVVTFRLGSQTLGTAALSSGTATLNLSTLPVGSDTVTASYPGDTTFAASGGSATETVIMAGTTTALTASPNPANYGQAVTLTAKVSASSGTVPNAEVITFRLGSQTLGTAPLSSGSAALNVTPPVGSDAITASYPGDSNFSASSGSTTETVNTAATTTALTVSPNPSTLGQTVTFTATVSSAGGAVPNGEVITFRFGSQTLGTASLSSGTASLSVSTLPAGSDTVTAGYPGDTNFAASSGLVVETVNAVTTTLVATAKGGCADNCASAGKFTIPYSGTLSCANNDVIFVGASSVFSNTAMSISDSGGTIAWKAIPPVNGSTDTTAAGWWGVCSNLASGTITISCTSGCTASTYMDGVAQWYQTAAPNPASDGNSSGTSAGSLTLSAAAANSGDLSFAYIVSKNGGTLATGSSGWTKRSTGLEATASGFDNLGSGSGSVSITVTGGSGEVAGVIQNLSFSSGPAASTTAVTGSPNPSSVGQAVTLTATVSSSGGTPPNGEIITFSFGSQTLGTAPLSNGTASLSVSTLPQGSDTVTASYPGDTNFAASTGSVVETVNATGTTTALAASPNPANVGQAVMLTATVSSSSGTPPNGEVITFTFGSQALGTAPLSNGTASLGVSNLPQGSDTVTASYPGDSTFGASSGSTTETVNAVSTTTTLSGSPNPSTYGQAVTLTATVSAGSGTVPNGEVVTFRLGSQTLGTAALSSGTATLNLSTLPVGSDTVTASYPGDTTFAASGGSATETVIMAGTTTALTASPNPANYGQAVTLTAKVSASSGTVPNAEVITFKLGSQTLGNAPLSSGTASLSVSTLPAGSDTVTASYPGDSNFSASGGSATETVNMVTTTTALSASPNPSSPGQTVTLTATVSAASGVAPNGEVITFTFGSQTLGAAPLSNGSASLSVSTLPVGSDTVTASYPGDGNFAASNGSATEAVNTVTTTLVATAKGGCAGNCASAGKFTIPYSGTLSCANNDVIFVGAGSVFSNTTMSISDSGGAITWNTIPPMNGSTSTTAAGWWGVCSNLTTGTITITCTSGCTGSTYMDAVAQWYQAPSSIPSNDGSGAGTSTSSLTLSTAAAKSGDLSFAYVVSKNGGTLATSSSGWAKRATGLEGTSSGFDNLGSGNGVVSVTVTGGSGQVSGVIQNLSF